MAYSAWKGRCGLFVLACVICSCSAPNNRVEIEHKEQERHARQGYGSRDYDSGAVKVSRVEEATSLDYSAQDVKNDRAEKIEWEVTGAPAGGRQLNGKDYKQKVPAEEMRYEKALEHSETFDEKLGHNIGLPEEKPGTTIDELEKNLSMPEDIPQQPKKLASNEGADFKQPTPMNLKAFIWPIEGRVIKKFNTDNEGLSIEAKPNAPVKAACKGVVVHVGKSVKNYGNIVILEHAEGYLTAYAHNNSILVRKGQKVEKGQVIAMAGQTGGVSKPQLMFSVKKGNVLVDPESSSRGP